MCDWSSDVASSEKVSTTLYVRLIDDLESPTFAVHVGQRSTRSSVCRE